MTYEEFMKSYADETDLANVDVIEVSSMEELKKMIAWLPSGTMLSMEVEE